MSRYLSLYFTLFLSVLLLSCGHEETERTFSEFEVVHGIGPITEEMKLGDIDNELTKKGQQLFSTLCVMCHNNMDSKVAPSLTGVLERRSPEYVLNMILNPAGMSRRHPSRVNQQAGYLTSMPFQSITKEDARAIVEYFRVEYSNGR
ncbi:MAG: cytochrome c [Balneolaceae bacterium]